MSDAFFRLSFHWANTRQRLLDAGNSPWLLRKTVIRALTAPLALVASASFAAAIMPWNQNFVHTNGPIKGDWQDSIPVVPLGLAFVYNLFATIYVLWNAQPVHSIFEGIVDFLIWAALIPGVVFAAWGGVFNLWTSATVEANGMVYCDMDMNALSRWCFPALYQIGELELAGVVFAIPVWLMHTFLFIHGCIEGCMRRRQRIQVQDIAAIKELESGRPAQTNWTNFSRVSYQATRPNYSPPPPLPRAYYR
ncbi:hypothetical protein VTN77DRAFT_6594 [Rasamsonia byssochlamydoides]|uniref:uncharacterized protein n=1 Tax=Rasamsonia byssochlamydoides TaxID=89139 RepID=UPI003742793B